MSHGKLSLEMVDHNGLAVAQIVAAGGSVADVTHCKPALGKLCQFLLIKNLTYQPQTHVGEKHPVVIDRDAAALLAPVLEGVQAIVYKSGHIRLFRTVDAEYPARFVDAYRPCSRLAFTKPRNRGWGLLGRLLNSG